MELQQRDTKTSYQLEKNEAYMNAKQLAYFKDLLLEMKTSILNHASDTKVHLQTDTSKLADIADRASQEEEFSLTLRSRDRERKLIYKIDAALERIVTGDFGFCEKCGVEIGIKRLEARPTAELCIDCKEIEEKKEKTQL